MLSEKKKKKKKSEATRRSEGRRGCVRIPGLPCLRFVGVRRSAQRLIVRKNRFILGRFVPMSFVPYSCSNRSVGLDWLWDWTRETVTEISARQ